MTFNSMTKYNKIYVFTNKRFKKGIIPKPLKSVLDVNLFKYTYNNLLASRKEQKTINKNIANYFQRFGFNVTMDSTKTNYIIHP